MFQLIMYYVRLVAVFILTGIINRSLLQLSFLAFVKLALQATESYMLLLFEIIKFTVLYNL